MRLNRCEMARRVFLSPFTARRPREPRYMVWMNVDALCLASARWGQIARHHRATTMAASATIFSYNSPGKSLVAKRTPSRGPKRAAYATKSSLSRALRRRMLASRAASERRSSLSMRRRSRFSSFGDVVCVSGRRPPRPTNPPTGLARWRPRSRLCSMFRVESCSTLPSLLRPRLLLRMSSMAILTPTIEGVFAAAYGEWGRLRPPLASVAAVAVANDDGDAEGEAYAEED